MTKDPAFLFYDGDAAKDVSHMNRLERGCYFDLMQAQRKFGRMKLSIIKKILGNDFEVCWESLELVLTYDNHMYFIEWLENSTIKRAEYSESRKRNRMAKKEDSKEDMKNTSKSYVNHMEDENGNTNVTVINNEKISFGTFWDLYDKKINKTKCEKRWDKLTVEIQEAIISHIPKYKEAQPDKQFRKHPYTFLNNNGWEDEIIKGTSNEPRGTVDLDKFQRELATETRT